jgi:DNA-binding response OmpR family regulator
MANHLALIIEDQEDIADIYSTALNLVGFETQIIYDGKVALEQLPSLEPDIIILDMNLPRVSGHYLFKQLKTIPHLEDVPVVICTANSVMANAMKSEIYATDFILVKPVSIHQLNGLVHRIFNK